MSVLNLPEPPNWAESGRLPLWVRLGLLVALVYVIGQGTLVVARGSYLTATVWFGTFGPLYLLMLALAFAPKRVVKARTTSERTGFTVWPDKTFTVLYFACLALTVPFAFLFAILLPRGMIDIDTTRGMQIFFPIGFAALAVVAAMGLVAGVRRGGVGYLKFTPAIIEIADVLKTRLLEWDDIVDVRDHSDTKHGKKAGRSVVLCLRDGSEQVIGGLDLYVPTGVPLYWMVRHYWKHPEDRMELVDRRATERFREGRFALD
ncbi:hypothetical protein A5698_08420 [Mycobacterium sp. E136]|uniref:hypothetical protein n=1 Tax=Mycobacterium sp. E136 TaxID=1834125 RepID=UPI0007FC5ECF|nr:hypothetical protein [Mycobacterium sp. E136]OBH00931.1 hypothetical protein A5698_08420 [Mycobacterium sp. E136]